MRRRGGLRTHKKGRDTESDENKPGREGLEISLRIDGQNQEFWRVSWLYVCETQLDEGNPGSERWQIERLDATEIVYWQCSTVRGAMGWSVSDFIFLFFAGFL